MQAYIAEIMRAGIISINKGQMEVAKSLGMNHFNAMKLIIIPQAIKNILPALAKRICSTYKGISYCFLYRTSRFNV